MQRYEATNSHNYTWIAELRPDFDMFRAREETHFLAIGILATERCNVSVNYTESDERYTVYGYVKLIFAEYGGNKPRKNVPFIFLHFF